MSTMATTTVSIVPTFTARLRSSKLRLPAIAPALHAAAGRAAARRGGALHPSVVVLPRRGGDRRRIPSDHVPAGCDRAGHYRLAGARPGRSHIHADTERDDRDQRRG